MKVSCCYVSDLYELLRLVPVLVIALPQRRHQPMQQGRGHNAPYPLAAPLLPVLLGLSQGLQEPSIQV